MKILHIGHGFYPYRKGGSMIHADALMQFQVKKGLDVYYFFSGRVFPFLKKPKLIKWIKNDIKMFEIVNSPLISISRGTKDPESYLNFESIELIFHEVMKSINPDIVHIQESLALPTSLIDIIKDDFKIPLIITIHDYSILCPTVKLFKYDNTNCIDKIVGIECCKCCYNAPSNNNVAVRATLAYHLEKFHIPTSKIYSAIKLFKKPYKSINNQKLPKEFKCNNNCLQVSYQKRRNSNIQRVEKADLIISHSYGSQKILSNFFDIGKIRIIHPTPDHLRHIQTNKKPKIKHPIQFGTLNGCSSIEKGADLILHTLEILNNNGLENQYNFHIWGSVSEEFHSEFLKFNNVYFHGSYCVENLNLILQNIDVGVVPSVWEEVYGFVGLEFLKKGIPVIGNERGGISDYVKDGSTGWLNKSSTAEELADIMYLVMNNPAKIQKLNNNIIKIKFRTSEENFNKINELYTELIESNLDNE